MYNESAWEDFLSKVESEEDKEVVEEITPKEKYEAIKKFYNFDDNTIQYFLFYRYNQALIDKLYDKAKKG